jgi:hypothetical protein
MYHSVVRMIVGMTMRDDNLGSLFPDERNEAVDGFANCEREI